MTVDGHCCSCQCTRPQRIIIQTLQRIRQTFNISFKHLEICHKNKTDRDRLCVLKMGKAYCNLIFIFFRLFQNYAFQIAQAVQNLINFFSQIQADIYLALIVTTSGGMKLFAHVSDFVNQAALDAHMDVFVFYGKQDLSFRNLLADFFQTCDDLIFFLIGYDALLSKHGHMRDAAVDVLVIHSLVKENRCIVFFYNIIHVFFKSSAP